MDNPNSKQEGGDHYAKGGNFQHWDLIARNGIGYLEGCATKYLTRWQATGTPELDLKKSIHFQEKLLDLAEKELLYPIGAASAEDIELFIVANEVGTREAGVVRSLCGGWNLSNLRYNLVTTRSILAEYQDHCAERPSRQFSA